MKVTLFGSDSPDVEWVIGSDSDQIWIVEDETEMRFVVQECKPPRATWAKLFYRGIASQLRTVVATRHHASEDAAADWAVIREMDLPRQGTAIIEKASLVYQCKYVLSGLKIKQVGTKTVGTYPMIVTEIEYL